MAVSIYLAAVVLLAYAPSLFAEELCGYMIAIPREPRPDDFPEVDYEGLSWSERPLVPAPHREDLCMDEYHSIAATQIIYMEEEIEGDIPIAKLNYYGTGIPEVIQFLSGSMARLGPVFRQINSEWFLVITERQDYEWDLMRHYMFRVGVPGESMTVLISLVIVNIDDNPPVIQALNTCRWPELEDPQLTNCVYEVTDADGEISTSVMRFTIESDRGDNEIFFIQGDNIEGDWFRMIMTIGVNQELNYEENALHIFSVTAWDSLPNTHTVTIMVQVENVEHRPPRWIEIFAVQQFDEKTIQNFTLRAIDGDTGINKTIHYRLHRADEDTFFSLEEIPGGHSGAILHVDKIDRDELERELFQLSIEAYKTTDAGEELSTETNIVIIVNDINDQRPEPFHKEYRLSIMEETAMTLDLEEFGFHDRDLGQHAQYMVHLDSEYPEGAENAFYIAPQVGYQRQTFIMGTLNHSMLDFEVEEFQHIKLKVIAIDMNDTTLTGETTLYIDLINWNDELPIFENSTQVITFDETEGSGFFVGTAIAHDRDIDDKVIHSLMGNAGNFLTIDEITGEIYVSIDDAFDYHRQNELFIQIRADDTLGDGPYHTETSQIVIQLNDINNTPPTLRLPRGSPLVEENVPEGYEITREITATDPDTTAELVFEIDWETSYATKQGRETSPEEYHGCVEIETLLVEEGNLGSVIGRVVVKEIRHNVTIDFEEFEVLYLTVRVRDLNTVIGEDFDEQTFTIIIEDMNDNPPVWAEGTLEQEFRVREMSASGAVIGSVLATDIDGPQYNQVRYTIFPREDTPENLVTINFVTGQITVNESGAIDADVPPRWYLYYTIIASDKCYEEDQSKCPPDPNYFNTEGNIVISITDINNKIPYPDTDKFNVTVYIYENAMSGDEIQYIVANDLDRDEMYNTVRYQINYAVNTRLRDFFAVDLDTGMLYVDYTTDAVLDRDRGEAEHRIFFNLIDNFFSEGDGNRNQNDTEVLVVLLDVNDNAPELPPPEELFWEVSENLPEGVRLEPDIYAPDIDEPDTDNSRVGYVIYSLTLTNRDLEPPELFKMIQIENVTGELETAMALRGYWGTYDIHIGAFDHGIPQQRSDEVYQLVITPYNYHAPVFVFPIHGTTVRLATERAVINGLLTTVSGEFLDRIAATDEDGLHAGVVTFTVTGDDDAMEYFEVANDGDNFGALRLTKLFVEDVKEFQVVIRATDGGTDPGPLFTESTLNVVFVPTQGDPIFSESTFSVAFFEKEGGLRESFQLPLAEDPKNYLCEDDCYDIFYRIVDGNEDGHFQVDSLTNVISLASELDRSEGETRVVVIAASNSLTPGAPLAGSTITVTVTVREAHPQPFFVRTLYTAGISVTDTINRELLTVQATHSEGATITYTIDYDSMQVDPSLEAVKNSAFLMNAQTGVLTLNMQPTAAMVGMFEFDAVATDPSGAFDTAEVKIYLVSSLNRVFFIFVNTVNQIEQNREFIAQTFSTAFDMHCNIDQVGPASDDNGVALDYLTEVRSHFVRDDIPIPAEEIELIRSDTELLRSIQTTLNTNLLVLQDFVTDLSPAVNDNSNRITVYVLAALSALLAFMCLVLLMTFIIKTRALNRRLEALSMTKYGSVDSGLNRVGLAAPGTNKHAIEGSNPIWNEALKAPDFDAISDASGDSDLIGIEDMPQFNNDYFPPGDTNSLQNIVNDGEPIAHHSNDFGFNTSPFSSEFTNKQFNR